MACSALFLSTSDHHSDPTTDPHNLKHVLSAPGLKDDNLPRQGEVCILPWGISSHAGAHVWECCVVS